MLGRKNCTRADVMDLRQGNVIVQHVLFWSRANAFVSKATCTNSANDNFVSVFIIIFFKLW